MTSSSTLSQSRNVAEFTQDVSTAQLSQLAEVARVDLGQPDDALATLAADELNRAEMSVLRAGAYLVQLKRQAGHGKWLPLIHAAGLSEDMVHRAMQIARYVAALPPAEAKRIAALPKTKVLALTKADPEVVGELLDSGELDGESPLSVRELRERLKKAERSNAKLQNDLETANNIRKRMAKADAALQAEEDLPGFALTVRREFVALTEAMSFDLDNLQATAEEHLFSEVKHPEAHRFQPVAAGTAYFALAGIHARCRALLGKLHDQYGDQLGMLTLDHQLSASELKRFEEQRAQLFEVSQDKRRERENARENARPGKRGAKRK